MSEVVFDFINILIPLTAITILYNNLNLFPKGRHFSYSILYVLITDMVLLCIGFLILPKAVHMILKSFIVFFMTQKMFGKSFIDTFWDLFIILIMIFIIKTTEIAIVKPIFVKHITFIDNDYYVNIAMNVLLLIIAFFVSRYKSFINVILKYRLTLERMPLSLLYISIPLVIIIFITNTIPNKYSNHLFVFLCCTWIFFTLNIIVLQKSINQIIEQKKIIETYQQYHPIISTMVQETKRKQHDYQNHLNVINIMLKESNGNSDTVKKYLESIQKYSDHSFLLELENKVLSGLIYSKLCNAKTKTISFSCNIEEVEHLPIKDYQLVEILGNIIDNAFEAVSLKEDIYKKVLLEMGSEDNGFLIRIKNNGPKIDPQDISKIFDYGYTTKGKDRGLGLYNVKMIVREMKGDISVYFDEDYTVFEILFQV